MPGLGSLVVLYRLLLTPVFVPAFYLGAVLLSWFVLPLVALVTRDPEQSIRRSRAAVRVPFRLLLRIGTALRIIHIDLTSERDGLPETPSVVAANHPTLMDVVFLTAVYGGMCFVVKRSLFRSVLIGGIVRFGHHIRASDGSPESTKQVLDSAVRG